MRSIIVFNLSSVLFKSYLRASRRSGAAPAYSRPAIMLAIDALVLVLPLASLQYVLPKIPDDLIEFLEPITWQTMVGLPILLTSAIITAGIMFELGQSSGLSSSEAVNWLPVSPREYVAASAISMVTIYSPLFAITIGATLPLALRFGFFHVWPTAMALSALALLLGAFIVEALKASMNRVSISVYRKSGRIGIISRTVLLLVLFIAIQQVFNPYVLYYVLGAVVYGVSLFWFVPAIWPSVAIVDLIGDRVLYAAAFSALSAAFTLLIFEVASSLRKKYWSPTPLSIVIKPSAEYVPHSMALKRFGIDPLEAALAMKDFKALLRRKDMARFLAVPTMMIIAFFLPTMFGGSEYTGRSPGFFLVTFIPFITSFTLSSISIGQEGKSMVNLCMLPISTKAIIKGKLLPPFAISAIGTAVAIVGFQIIAPMSILSITATILACTFEIIIQGFIGLGIATRYPDFTAGPRSRYVTFTGFLLGLSLGGLTTLAAFMPTAFYILSSEVQGIPSFHAINFITSLLMTIAIGSFLSYLSYRYCKGGVQNLISNLT